MNERLAIAEAIFHAVVDAPPGERDRLLSERCAGDAELRAYVERLLAHDQEGMGEFLSPSTRTTVDPQIRSDLPPPIGPYHILDVLAEGGMGTVFLARQSEPMERDVALKVIREGMGSKEIIARFEAERQALALMDHPNIAKVLDAGQTDQGHPYFVMELIRGTPITEYCDHRRLGVRGRLELFLQVCDAVQHAHQKAVIHRDLKPLNVLVAEADGKPVPKVIDFGVAKAVGKRLTRRTMYTGPGVLIGTLEYMSPEQADFDNQDVDTRVDVYSLGVILYELLAGLLPFEGGGTMSLLTRIRQGEPKRPSTRISPSDSSSVERARVRGLPVQGLRRLLRGDLDWIVMKALEKDRGRRYASPSDLAADIRRHLRDETVVARPPSAGYRARKFIRRHRLGVTAATVVVLTLLGAVVGTSMALVRARRAEAQARAEQERSQRASDFLATTLRDIDVSGMAYDLATTLRGRLPGQAALSPPPLDARTPDPRFAGLNLIDEMRSMVDQHVLDGAVRRIENDLHGEPAISSDLYRAIGEAYESADSARIYFERAVALSEQARGRDAPATIAAKMKLASGYSELGQYPNAVQLYREAVDSSRRINGEDSRGTIQAMAELGMVYQQWSQAWVTLNDPTRRPPHTRWSSEALSILRPTFERSRRVLGPDDATTLFTANALGLAMVNEGHYAEAESLFHDLIPRSSRALGEADVLTLMARTDLITVPYYSGRVDQALRMAEDLLAHVRKVQGNNGEMSLILELKLGVMNLDEGRLDEAEPLLRASAKRSPLVLGSQNQFAREAVQALARLERLRRASRTR